MTADEKTMRIGLSSPEAFECWVREMESILNPGQGEVPGWDAPPPLTTDLAEGRVCHWALGHIETGSVEFNDAGDMIAEMTLQVDHSNPDTEYLAHRLDGILERYGQAIGGASHTIDPPAQLEDPQPGAAPDERTDPDQPL